ncbi:MAG TPA: hypothetical protein VEV63_00180 [Streptosporangiaceae bacterium]|nr:hypothetical protein [Streptosporangiaceae bacterium]
MDLDDRKTSSLAVLAEPGKRQFVTHGKHDERIRGRMPVSGQRGKGSSEVERRMRYLTTLRTKWKIVARDQIQALGEGTLPVRHMPIIAVGCGGKTSQPDGSERRPMTSGE